MDKIKEIKAEVFDCLAVIEQYTARKTKLLQELNTELQKEKAKKDGQGTSVSDTTTSE